MEIKKIIFFFQSKIYILFVLKGIYAHCNLKNNKFFLHFIYKRRFLYVDNIYGLCG